MCNTYFKLVVNIAGSGYLNIVSMHSRLMVENMDVFKERGKGKGVK